METLRYFQSINIPLYELFGMSECSGPMTVSIPGHVVSGSCGIALDGCEMKVINQDEEGNGEVRANPKGVYLQNCAKRMQTKFIRKIADILCEVRFVRPLCRINFSNALTKRRRK